MAETVTIDSSDKISDLYDSLAKKSKLPEHRLRITKGSDGSVLNNTKNDTIYSTGLRNQSTVYVKDLGPQIAWRTVFIIEYAGPILIHPAIFALRPYIYPSAPAQASQLQTTTLLLILLHFIKRELETIFVHRFSAATMPFNNVFRNSAHYWILGGLNIAAWIYAPFAPTAKEANPLILYTGLILYALGEFGNLQVHLTLMNLRSPGGTERAIPQGKLFDMVTCPNYMTETVSWLGVWIVSNFSWSVLLFAAVATGTMMSWAKKKELRYRKEFGNKYKKKRYVMIPGIY